MTVLSPVLTERKGSVLLVTIANPPVNAIAIGAGVVAGLADALHLACSDPAVTAIVIRGHGRDFSCGADINDFDQAPDEVDRLRELFAQVALCAKPVIAMLHGNVLGAGLELALAADVRLVTADARLGFPEVNLGLLPGGGGTQRLPRLAGIAAALDMMLGGKPVAAMRAVELGLASAVADEAAALGLAAEYAVEWRGRDNPPLAVPDAAAVADRRAQIARQRSLGSARSDIIDCVEATATLGLEDGLSFERERFSRLLLSEASLGLRHSFFAERKAGRLSAGADEAPSVIERVAVIGAGTMGSGIAVALAASGLAVTLVEPGPAALEAGLGRIAAIVERDVAKGRLSAEAAAARMALLCPAGTLDACARADLVIEAVYEDLAVKQAIFQELDRIVAPGAILASNTSTLDIDAIAQVTRNPERVAGLHFFSPAHIMRLVEVVRGGATARHTLASLLALVRRMGKVGVVAGNCDGFVGNRIFEEYLRQAYWLLEEGALPAQVDAALERWGMAMGPCRTMDLAGQDIGWSIRKRRAISQPDRPYSRIPDLICEMGRFGQKTQAGYYLYPDGRTAQPDPEIDRLIVRHSQEIGVSRREISDQEIVDRCLLAMIAEGAKIVAEGVAARPADIDVIYLNGYGFPAERGGPMFQADLLGLPDILARMARLAEGREGWAWADRAYIADLVAHGASFGSMNG